MRPVWLLDSLVSGPGKYMDSSAKLVNGARYPTDTPGGGMEDKSLSDALLAANDGAVTLYFSVIVPRPDAIGDLLDHIKDIHSSLVDAGCISVGFPNVGMLGEQVLF
jgi:hypothetical protein